MCCVGVPWCVVCCLLQHNTPSEINTTRHHTPTQHAITNQHKPTQPLHPPPHTHIETHTHTQVAHPARFSLSGTLDTVEDDEGGEDEQAQGEGRSTRISSSLNTVCVCVLGVFVCVMNCSTRSQLITLNAVWNMRE